MFNNMLWGSIVNYFVNKYQFCISCFYLLIDSHANNLSVVLSIDALTVTTVMLSCRGNGYILAKF